MPDLTSKRPWYARALTCGIGIGIGLALSLLSGHGSRAEGAQVIEETARWRDRMESKIDALTEKVANIEGRLTKR